MYIDIEKQITDKDIQEAEIKGNKEFDLSIRLKIIKICQLIESIRMSRLNPRWLDSQVYAMELFMKSLVEGEGPFTIQTINEMYQDNELSTTEKERN